MGCGNSTEENTATSVTATSRQLSVANEKTIDLSVTLSIRKYMVSPDDDDPNKIVSSLAGIWKGPGKDTIFVTEDESKLDGVTNGFTTPYNETVEFVAIPGGILNPSKLTSSQPAGSEGETLFGVRYFRQVVSTLDSSDDNNPFKKGSSIHQEVGYILFCYVGAAFTADTPASERPKLKRVVKSLAIPRAQTVLAWDESPSIKSDESGNITSISYKLEAYAVKGNVSALENIWIVGNGEFTSKHAKVTEFTQTVDFNFPFIDPLQSTFNYTQETPIKFIMQDKLTKHTNSASLTKVAHFPFEK